MRRIHCNDYYVSKPDSTALSARLTAWIFHHEGTKPRRSF
jgi:hypothetical protein